MSRKTGTVIAVTAATGWQSSCSPVRQRQYHQQRPGGRATRFESPAHRACAGQRSQDQGASAPVEAPGTLPPAEHDPAQRERLRSCSRISRCSEAEAVMCF
mgnify:CR=1 FL=1